MLEAYIDGASRGNPGEAGIGAAIKEKHRTIKEISEYIGKTTNNVAEYSALIRALEEVLMLGRKKARFISDSQLIVEQINGNYRVKEEHLKILYNHAKVLIKKFDSFSIKHVPREENKEADNLANKAIDDHA